MAWILPQVLKRPKPGAKLFHPIGLDVQHLACFYSSQIPGGSQPTPPPRPQSLGESVSLTQEPDVVEQEEN